jgi:hypothetical protein
VFLTQDGREDTLPTVLDASHNYAGFSAMKHRFSPSSRVRIPDGILSRNLQGEEVILNLDTGVYWGLDPLGARIWQLLQQQSGPDAIVKTLLEEYDVPEARLRLDIEDLLTRLVENGLVEVIREAVD